MANTELQERMVIDNSLFDEQYKNFNQAVKERYESMKKDGRGNVAEILQEGYRAVLDSLLT